MEAFNIKLTEQQLAFLNKPWVDMEKLLNACFEQGSSNFNLLAYELQREFRQGGSPDITRIVLNRVAYDKATGKGQFRAVLDIRFTFSCEDSVSNKTDQTSEWTFMVNATAQTISFYSSPFAESRSTADEF